MCRLFEHEFLRVSFNILKRLHALNCLEEIFFFILFVACASFINIQISLPQLRNDTKMPLAVSERFSSQKQNNCKLLLIVRIGGYVNFFVDGKVQSQGQVMALEITSGINDTYCFWYWVNSIAHLRERNTCPRNCKWLRRCQQHITRW